MQAQRITNFLLLAIAALLFLLIHHINLVPFANAAPTIPSGVMLGCHIKYKGAQCDYVPILVDVDGRLMVVTK